jgi:hypothetical protein
MMMHLQSIILPAIIVLLPVVLLSIYRLSNKSKTKRQVVISGLLFLLLGLAVPWIATYISVVGLDKELPEVWLPARGGGQDELLDKLLDERSKYVSKALFFLYYGYLINLIGIPCLELIFYFKRKKEAKLLTSEQQ